MGCNIMLSALPIDATIYMVQNGVERSPESVRQGWRTCSFLQGASSDSRRWLADVLACVREIAASEFTLKDLYRFEDRLAWMHTGNRNVRPKIRQQLQVLRDHGVLEFLGHGRYRVLLTPQTE